MASVLAWIPIAVGFWWMAGGGVQEEARVLWVDGTAEEVSINGERRDLMTGDGVVQQRISVADGASLWLLDRTRSILHVRGPGTYLSIGGVIRSANDAGSEPFARSAAFFIPPPVEDAPGTILGVPDGTPASHLEGTPRHTMVAEGQPLLRWAVAGPEVSYDLVLEQRQLDGSMRPVERWRGMRGGVHAPPSRLVPGRWYRWTVSRTGWIDRDGITAAVDPLRTSWFRVLPAKAHARVRAQLEECDALEDAGDQARPGLASAAAVLRVEILEAHGLFQDAEDAWAALARAHPDDPGIARRLQRMQHRSIRPPERGWRFPLLSELELL